MTVAFLHGNGGTDRAGGILTVTVTEPDPAGVLVTVSKGDKSYSKMTDTDGVVVFKGLTTGKWTVTIADEGMLYHKYVDVVSDYSTTINSNVIPDFTYTGDYEIVNDNDEPITVTQDNWKIRFLTSGTLTFSDLRSASDGIDVFMVGGGGGGGRGESAYYGAGGGGGGGYTKTLMGISIDTGLEYSIIIGSGGSISNGGTTSAFSENVSGGESVGGRSYVGAAGGSGGGSGCTSQPGIAALAGSGGSDGNDGDGTSGGIGQGTTTREFGETTGTLYAGGGGGGGAKNDAGAGSKYNPGAGGSGGGGFGGRAAGSNGIANTGGGGGGAGEFASANLSSGGSGIVIIRNARGTTYG